MSNYYRNENPLIRNGSGWRTCCTSITHLSSSGNWESALMATNRKDNAYANNPSSVPYMYGYAMWSENFWQTSLVTQHSSNNSSARSKNLIKKWSQIFFNLKKGYLTICNKPSKLRKKISETHDLNVYFHFKLKQSIPNTLKTKGKKIYTPKQFLSSLTDGDNQRIYTNHVKQVARNRTNAATTTKKYIQHDWLTNFISFVRSLNNLLFFFNTRKFSNYKNIWNILYIIGI